MIPVDKNDRSIKQENESTQIRYYKDRVNFHGEILMKPKAAKSIETILLVFFNERIILDCRLLWEFLYILLEDSDYQSIIQWENREKMIFRIIQADKLAALWGLQKNRISMTYEKLSRGMRYYYSNNIIMKEQSKRLLYRFMRSPDEIRRNMKHPLDSNNRSSSPITNSYLEIFSISSRTNSSSSESTSSSKKHKQTYSIPSIGRLSQDYPSNQPVDLVIPKQEHFMNYKKQKFLCTIEQ